MFVQTGAKMQIVAQRKSEFYEAFVTRLVAEAKSLAISEQELIDMIHKAL